MRLSRSGRVGPVKTLSAAGYNAYNEGVAASANGTSTFVWALYTPSASWIQEVRRDSKGRLGKVKTLSGLASSSEQPDIADSANGTGTIVWRVWDGSVYRIQTVRLDPKGRSGRVRTLSSPSQYAKYPQVATSAGGRSTIAWQTDNGPKIIEAVTIDARGRIGGRRSLTAPSKSATDPQVGASPSGKGSITWRLQDGASYLIQAIRF